MMIAFPCLFITFVIYLLVPNRNMIENCLFYYLGSLSLAYFLYIFGSVYQIPFNSVLCGFMGMSAYFCTMTAIFWTNIVYFDFHANSNYLQYVETIIKNAPGRFLRYSVYAWGGPFVFSTVLVVMNHTVKPYSLYDPGIRGQQCFLQDSVPTIMLYYTPLVLLLMANIIMFCHAVWKNKNEHYTIDEKQGIQFYLMLLVAIGMNWSVEIIHLIVIFLVAYVPVWIWHLTDFCNAVHGISIFCLCVFKRSVWEALSTRFHTIKVFTRLRIHLPIRWYS